MRTNQPIQVLFFWHLKSAEIFVDSGFQKCSQWIKILSKNCFHTMNRFIALSEHVDHCKYSKTYNLFKFCCVLWTKLDMLENHIITWIWSVSACQIVLEVSKMESRHDFTPYIVLASWESVLPTWNSYICEISQMSKKRTWWHSLKKTLLYSNSVFFSALRERDNRCGQARVHRLCAVKKNVAIWR